MRPGIELRQDYDAARLRALAKATRNAGQSRRLLVLAEIYDGGTRDRVAQIDWEPHSVHSMAFVYAVRTDFGRPSSSMRLRA
jgi:hypothetical protein